jgi:hypothetical protein
MESRKQVSDSFSEEYSSKKVKKQAIKFIWALSTFSINGVAFPTVFRQ